VNWQTSKIAKIFTNKLVLLKENSDGFERDKINNFALPELKKAIRLSLMEKRDSFVRKLKTPIVSGDNSEIKIKQLKTATIARRRAEAAGL